MAINDLRKDLKIFEDYANFDSKDINTIKTKKKITDGVDLQFQSLVDEANLRSTDIRL